jgi:hypothetical protein
MIQLNFVVSCGSGQHCSWYARYRQVGTGTWTRAPAAPHGPVTGPIFDVPLSEHVTGLTPGVQYEYQVCGNAQPGQPFICVGPDDTPKTTTKFPTRPTVTNIDNGDSGADGVPVPVIVGQIVTISGTGFSTATGATTFDFGAANPATSVTCSSTTSCDVTVPPSAGDANPDVIATVVGMASLPNPPADQVIYFPGFRCCPGIGF